MLTPVRILVMNFGEDMTLTPAVDAVVVMARRDLLGDSEWPYDDLLGTHVHSGGHYVNASGAPENEPQEGQWLLVVRAPDRATVVQRLTFELDGDVIRARAGWGARSTLHDMAKTVSIVNYVEAREEVDADRPRHCVLTVNLYPVAHFVALACVHRDATYDFYASGRRDRLFDEGALHDGAIAHLISARRNVTEVFVKSAHPRPDSWIKVAERNLKPDAEKTGVLDFYAVLKEIGASEPGSVVEASYWGHAWHNGLVVHNTVDESPDLLRRDENDYDGRPKDWHLQGPIGTDYRELKSAFAPEGRFLVGGCSFMSNVMREARASNEAAAQGKGRDEYYEAPMAGGHLHTTLDYTKRNIGQFVQATHFGKYDIKGSACGLATYVGLAAQQLGVDVFGAPPGCEANLGFVPGSAKVRHHSMKVLAPRGGANIILLKFYRREFGGDFEQDDLGYVNYTKLLSASLPDPGWSTLRYAVFDDWVFGRVLRLPSGLLVRRDKQVGNYSRPVPYQEGRHVGHVYVVPGAQPHMFTEHPYLDGRVERRFLTKDNPQMDLGLFVTRTGTTFVRVRARGEAGFREPPEPLMCVDVELAFEPWWEPVPGTERPLPSSELESVEPRCYW